MPESSFPTLAALCGIEPPDDLQGRSLLPVLKDPKAPGKDVVYTVVSRGPKLGRAIRTKRWHYARWSDGEELYKLENDIEEHYNLARLADDKSTLDNMRTHLYYRLPVRQGQRKRKAAENIETQHAHLTHRRNILI
ncbi:MAG: hypothetical protein GWQ05_24360 [Verrucomicrobiaceae bacterium]|nr:hypothetical protein [Verrucomicrobiaceae bacterium]